LITRQSGLKKLASGLFRRNPNSIAIQSVKHTKIRQRVLAKLLKQIQREIHKLCSKKHNSMLLKSSFEELVKFSWNALVDEIKDVAPLFYTFMKGCTTVQRKNDKRKKTISEVHYVHYLYCFELIYAL